MLIQALFYVFATILVLAALWVITARNPVYSALGLVMCFITSAAIWLLLEAEFLAVVLVLVYVGAVMVLFLFVIMLVRVNAAVPQMRFRMQKLVALAVVFALGFEVLVILFSADKLPGEGLFVQEIAGAGKLPPNSEALARSLFTTYSLPFEMAGVLLLVAIVGAVVMAKSRNRTDES